MTIRRYLRPAYKRRVTITPQIEAEIVARLGTTSQQRLAREFGVSQATVSRVARRAGTPATGAHHNRSA